MLQQIIEIAPPFWLSIKLATVTLVILLLIGTPVASWLAHTRSRFKPFWESLFTLPLILPPTVLGFYLLVLFGPQGFLGSIWIQVTGETLAFSFSGLVLGSVIYSLPFVIQPLIRAFEEIGEQPREAAMTLGADKRDIFFSIILPMAKRGYITAAALGFAHTLGEFGVVLLIGGNIPGRTQVVSIAIYESVETMEYAKANLMAGILLVISFSLIFLINWNSKPLKNWIR